MCQKVVSMKMKLYKYISLDKLQYLESYFKQEIFLSPLDSFNDPFEGRFCLKSLLPETILSKPKLFQEILDQHKIIEPNLTAGNLKIRLKSKEFQDSIINKKIVYKHLFNSHGAICLTRSPNNIPMWAYYGKAHTGCCIEFELDFNVIQRATNINDTAINNFSRDVYNGETLISFNLPGTSYEFVFVRVKYEKKIPTIDLNKIIDLPSLERTIYIVSNSVGVKFIQWQHEQEFRLICNSYSNNSDNLLPLKAFAPFLKITGVIMGSAIKDKNKKTIIEKTEAYNLSLFSASCSKLEYLIEINKYKNHIDTDNKNNISEKMKAEETMA